MAPVQTGGFVAQQILSKKRLLCALAISLLMCWPALVFDASFVFADTRAYLKAGDAIWQIIGDIVWFTSATDVSVEQGTEATTALSTQGVGASVSNLVVNDSGGSTVGRSFTYSAAVYPLFVLGGTGAVAFAQALFLSVLIVALVPQNASRATWVALSLVCLLSTLPWFAVYQTPDIFAAAPLLFAAMLVGPLNSAPRTQAWFLAALSAASTTFHYGYPPLAAGVCGFALLWLAMSGSLSRRSVAMVIVVVSAGPAINFIASGLVLKEPSTSPQRAPIALARSLEDGPALWYLEEACPTSDLAICTAFEDGIPSNIGDFLWSEEGVLSLDPAVLAQIRKEEVEVLSHAFRAYPIEQTWSLAGNAVKQFFRIGTKAMRNAYIEEPNYNLKSDEKSREITQWVLDLSPYIAAFTWLAALPFLVFLVSGRLNRQQTGMGLAVLLGLVLNALVFGGLSAPDWRYQSRIAWLLPLMSALLPTYVMHNRSRRRML